MSTLGHSGGGAADRPGDRRGLHCGRHDGGSKIVRETAGEQFERIKRIGSGKTKLMGG